MMNSATDLRLVPFHLLASEGKAHAEQNHLWPIGPMSDVCSQAICSFDTYCRTERKGNRRGIKTMSPADLL